MSGLAGHRSCFLHQYNQLRETSVAEVAGTLLSYAGATMLFVKAMDQADWMATYDPDPLHIDSLETLREQTLSYEQNGITLLPWVVPGHEAQANLHAALAIPENDFSLVVDAEPYRQFWLDGSASFLLYISDLRRLGVKNLYVSVDPRPSATEALGVGLWAAQVDCLLGQYYWTDFEQPASVIAPLFAALGAFGRPQMPVLPFNGAADFAAVWGQIGPMSEGVSLWKLGSANAAQLQAFSALAVTLPPDPLKERCDELLAENKRLHEGLAGLALQAQDLLDAIAELEAGGPP